MRCLVSWVYYTLFSLVDAAVVHSASHLVHFTGSMSRALLVIAFQNHSNWTGASLQHEKHIVYKIWSRDCPGLTLLLTLRWSETVRQMCEHPPFLLRQGCCDDPEYPVMATKRIIPILTGSPVTNRWRFHARYVEGTRRDLRYAYLEWFSCLLECFPSYQPNRDAESRKTSRRYHYLGWPDWPANWASIWTDVCQCLEPIDSVTICG